jgi:predicted transcriptional regulator
MCAFVVGERLRSLGQLEAAVMDAVWGTDGGRTVRDVLSLLQNDRKLAYTTVMTVMDNLHSKGLLTRERVGRAYEYRPARTRGEFEADLMDEVLATSQDRTTTLLRFVERIPAEELDELRALIGQDPGVQR